jgi:hypothetical protein
MALRLRMGRDITRGIDVHYNERAVVTTGPEAGVERSDRGNRSQGVERSDGGKRQWVE